MRKEPRGANQAAMQPQVGIFHVVGHKLFIDSAPIRCCRGQEKPYDARDRVPNRKFRV
jgi:hypothetical protein